MDYVYDPEHAAQIAGYIYYTTPVEGVQRGLRGAATRRSPNSELIFPTEEFTADCSTQPSLDPTTSRRSRRHGRSWSPAEPTGRLSGGSRDRRRLSPILLGPGPALARACSSSSPCTSWASSRSRRGRWRTASLSPGSSRTSRDAISKYSEQFLRSFVYGGIATALALLIAYPLAYAIAFRGGPLQERAPARGDGAVLHHLPDPHPRLADDPLRPEPARRRAATHRPGRRRRPRARHPGLGDRRPHLQLPARS